MYNRMPIVQISLQKWEHKRIDTATVEQVKRVSSAQLYSRFKFNVSLQLLKLISLFSQQVISILYLPQGGNTLPPK